MFLKRVFGPSVPRACPNSQGNGGGDIKHVPRYDDTTYPAYIMFIAFSCRADFYLPAMKQNMVVKEKTNWS